MPNRTIPLIAIPANCLPAKNLSGALLSLASMALTQGLAVVHIDTTGLDRKSVFVPPVLDARIMEFAEGQGWSYQDTFAALCAISVDAVLRSRATLAADSGQVTVPFATRPGQDLYYKSMLASINKGRVCLAEASTGIGKSRAIVAAAMSAAMAGKTPAVIAAPTLAILGGSLWPEYEALVKAGLGVSCKARFFPGATEFIDYDRLVAYLDGTAQLGEPVDSAVKAWVDSGCPALTETPLIRALTKSGRRMKFLMSDLRDLATNLDPLNFAYRPSAPGNEGIKDLLDAVRADAVGADIIFCTHAMLVVAKIGAWEWFPQPNALFVDEAHLFEGIASSVTSSALSLLSFRHDVRYVRQEVGLSAATSIGRLEAALTDLINASKALDAGGGGLRLGPGLSEEAAFLDALARTSALLKIKAVATLPRAPEARECLRMVIAAIGAAPSTNAYGRLEFSPDRRFPSLLVGNRSVAGLLGAIWHDAAGGVVLASASLSSPDAFGNSKFDYIAQLLALPISRLDSPTPIVAPWLTTIPVLHLPAVPSLLARPTSSSRTDESEYQWLSSLAEQLLYVADQALGGTLVLMTSYAQVNVLAEILGGFGLQDRLVVQSADEKFQACEHRYRTAHAAGMRPVMLGLGVAWTGVDLTDKTVPPHEDTMVSDLVIGCIPVGLNRSSTMAARIDRQGVYPIIKETLMVLMQGMGRCIRSEHARGKHIWLMDGRLWVDWPGMLPLQQSARRVIERYANRETFG